MATEWQTNGKQVANKWQTEEEALLIEQSFFFVKNDSAVNFYLYILYKNIGIFLKKSVNKE